MGRGLAYESNGRYDRAIQDFDQVLRLTPNDAFAYINRGATYAEMGEYDHARSDFNRALALGYDRARVEALLTGLP